MHLFKELAVKDYDAAAAKIPVLDYGPYFSLRPEPFYCLGPSKGNRLLDPMDSNIRRFLRGDETHWSY